VAGADPANPWRALRSGGNELALRVGSGLVLVPLAIGTAYVGGWPFVIFWGIAAIGVLWEWTALVAGADQRPALAAGCAALVLALVLVATEHQLAGAMTLALGVLAVAVLAPPDRRNWMAAGLPYAGALGIVSVILRFDPANGFLAIVFLFAVVWATDIVAYFVGRAIGGPKLWPKVSPKKTWSGALGGTVAATVLAIVIAESVALPGLLAIALLAVALSAFAQIGDLFESFLKRKFGAKDSSQLIPGHGGLMDRLDGFVSAAVVAALIGITRGGMEAPGRGLLVW
jgi:phosphatidate cytidylyltransferase